MAGRSASLMDGSNGKKKATRNSLTSFTVKTASPSSWRLLAASLSSEEMKQDVGGKEAEEITANGTVPADQFTWHPVSRAVGNVKTKGPELIENSAK